MTPDDFDVFSARLVELGEVYDAKLSDSKQVLYFQALQDLPLEAVTSAIQEALRTLKFFPKPAELRALAVGDTADYEELAWQEYKRLAREVGGYGSPELGAVLGQTLVAVFGSWEGACWSDFSPEMWASKRKEFGRVFRMLSQRGLSGAMELPGFCERENQLKGDIQAVRQVMGEKQKQLEDGE